MKILYLSDDFPPKSYGGAGIIAYTDARALAARGHEVRVVTTTQDPKDAGVIKKDSLTIHVIYSNYHPRWRHYISLNNKKVVDEVIRVIEEFKPDVVHVHNIHSHISYKALQYATKKVDKVFLTAHDVMMVHYGKMSEDESKKVSLISMFDSFGTRVNPFRNFYIKKYIKNVTKIFAVSDAIRNVLISNGIKNVETLHNGIDVAEWQADPAQVQKITERYSLQNKKVILFGGRMSGPKGANVLIEALPLIKKEVPNAMLLFVGKEDGVKNIPEDVTMTGWVDRGNMKNIYAASDVVTVPSLYIDPFPTINLEAMASKKPVVGTKFGGTKEAVVDNETGYIVDPHDVPKLASKISDLLLHSEKARAFGEAGYRHVKASFNLDIHVEALLAWYTRKNV